VSSPGIRITGQNGRGSTKRAVLRTARSARMHVIYMYVRRAIRAADPADSHVQARTALPKTAGRSTSGHQVSLRGGTTARAHPPGSAANHPGPAPPDANAPDRSRPARERHTTQRAVQRASSSGSAEMSASEARISMHELGYSFTLSRLADDRRAAFSVVLVGKQIADLARGGGGAGREGGWMQIVLARSRRAG
jgi:hypothetical protein